MPFNFSRPLTNTTLIKALNRAQQPKPKDLFKLGHILKQDSCLGVCMGEV